MDDNPGGHTQQHRAGAIPVDGPSINMVYLKSKPGLLKVAEIVLLVIAFASLTGYTSTYIDKDYGGRYDFFYFATITTWLLVITIFLLFFSNLNNRVNINWNLVLMVYSTVTAVLLLLSSALVLDAVINHRKKEEQNLSKSSKGFVRFCTVEKCGNIEAAGAFGVLSTVLFIIDAVFFFIENRSGRAAPPPGAEQF